jgi:ComF family protein
MVIKVDRHLERVCGWLLPPRCILCGGAGQRPCLDLCGDCERSLPRRPSALAGGCLAPFEYAFPLDRLVHALKYQGQLAVGRVLGTLLGAAVLEHDLQRDVDVVVPVPLHPRRHAERTFNQSAEIARRVARVAGIACREGASSRLRDTRPQVGLGLEARRDNLAGAFTCRADPQGATIALVDDVMTTGSTARAMLQALRSCEAVPAGFWCIARAGRTDAVDSGSRAPARNV